LIDGISAANPVALHPGKLPADATVSEETKAGENQRRALPNADL